MMDVVEAIRRRRMHRVFAPNAVSDEQLDRLVWAAGRAPMGGAELVRRIVVVTEPRLVRTVRQVTPSFLANAPAMILICTDLERAEISMGIQGRDVLSLVDAGAAAENVALMALTLGLGVCFVRSSNDAALQEVLDLPQHVRPDVLIAVGRPAETPSPGVRGPDPIVFRDGWGYPWEART
jgi:nitroreductase